MALFHKSILCALALSALTAFPVSPVLAQNVANVDTSNWQTYGGASSPMSIQFPPGWTASTDASTGRLDLRSQGGATLSILPFYINYQTIESLNPKQFFALLIKLFAPNETWSEPQPVGTNAFRSTYTNEKESASSAIVLQSAGSGVAGQVCVAKLPKGSASVSNDVLATIMQTLKYNSPSASSVSQAPNAVSGEGTSQHAPDAVPGEGALQHQISQSVVSWTTFTDPSENSFTVDVPQGWKVDGGLTRVSALDVRPWVKAVSPDDLVIAFIGDGKITPFTMPTAQGTALGFGVGSVYNGTIVRPYMPARQFAEQYAKSNLKSFIRNLQVVDEHNHPDVALAVNGTTGATKSEAASIKLTGMYGDIPAVAYYLAVTKATVAYGTGMWWVTKVAGSVSPADREGEGLAVVLRMLQSFAINPDWSANSLRNTAAVSQHYRQVSQQVSKSISDRYWSQQAHNDRMNQAYWNRQASQDRAANNFSNYIRGVENVQDPTTGTKYQVQYGPAGHYIDSGSNYIVGGDHGAPSPEWRELISVP